MPNPNPVAIFAPPLNQLGLRWMAVGSIASNAFGEFRVTNDVDLILVLPRDQAKRLAEAFPESEFYCPPIDVMEQEAARDERGHFNLIHHETGFKADIYLAGADPLQKWALRHRREIELDDSVVWIAPPEYVVIGKLEFFREGSSEKHLRDIRGMLAVTLIDRTFLEKEVSARGLLELWRPLVENAPAPSEMMPPPEK
jgi:hypothetical protein